MGELTWKTISIRLMTAHAGHFCVKRFTNRIVIVNDGASRSVLPLIVQSDISSFVQIGILLA